MSSEDRRYARVITDLDLVLSDDSGRVLDDGAQASDLSPVGFRASTQIELKVGDRVRFLLLFEDGQKIDGLAEAVWVKKDGWGSQTAGFKFARISWKARRLLRQTVPQERYDFVGLARKAAISIYWVVVVAGLHNVAFHQPQLRAILSDLFPVIAAALVLSAGLLLAFW